MPLSSSEHVLVSLGVDGQGSPSAEVLRNLGDLEDHLVQPPPVTDGETEKQRSSYQDQWREENYNPNSLPKFKFFSYLQVITPHGAATQKNPMPAISACPLLCFHLVSMGIMYLLLASRLALGLRSHGSPLVLALEA